MLHLAEVAARYVSLFCFVWRYIPRVFLNILMFVIFVMFEGSVFQMYEYFLVEYSIVCVGLYVLEYW